MKRVFIGYTDHSKAHLLTSAIDEINLRLESSSNESIELASAATSFSFPFFPNYAWVSPDSIQSWYKSTQFHGKFLDFRRLHKIWSEEIQVWPTELTEEFRNCGLSVGPARPRKLWLLERLMEVSNTLSLNYDAELESYFHSLEAEFNTCLTADDIIILAASGRANIHNPSILYLYQKFLRSDLVLLLKTIFIRINRDLRHIFRCIVNFLFKNMADESDANDFLFNRYLNKNFVIVKFNHDVHKQNNRTSRASSQYKGLYS